MAKLVLGTRGSALALWQARHVAALLTARHPDVTVEERIITTAGDQHPQVAIGPEERGFFVRGLEQALLSGDIDLAVHSLKDLPSTQPEGLEIAVVLERHDPRDALVSVEGFTLESLPRATVIGTGSPRRRCQLLHSRPDLKIVPVRGNVDSRVRLLRERGLGALVLALAGLERLGIDSVAVVPLAPETCVPAVGQGVLAVEIRTQDQTTRSRVADLEHAPTRAAITAERSFLARLGGGCLAPATAFARANARRLSLEAMVGDTDGHCLLLERDRGPSGDAAAIGARAAERLLVAGADKLLSEARRLAESGDRGR